MKKRTILLAFIISAVAMTSGCSANEPKTDEVKQEQTKTESVSSGVTIKPLTQKAIDENPYMAKNDANIHHDCYNSDSTDEVMLIRSEADLDNFKKMYGINEKIEKEY